MDQCRDCKHFIPKTNRCFLHGPEDAIAALGWCKYFDHGWPGASGNRPQGLVTKAGSAYVDDARKSMNLGKGRKT